MSERIFADWIVSMARVFEPIENLDSAESITAFSENLDGLLQ